MIRRLVLFTRYPAPGRTKTRMIPALGAQEAADLQRQMTRHVLARIRHLAEPAGVEFEVWHEGGGDSSMRACYGSSFFCRPRPDGDLGQRLAGAFNVARQAGIDRTVVIGADCPGSGAG